MNTQLVHLDIPLNDDEEALLGLCVALQTNGLSMPAEQHWLGVWLTMSMHMFSAEELFRTLGFDLALEIDVDAEPDTEDTPGSIGEWDAKPMLLTVSIGCISRDFVLSGRSGEAIDGDGSAEDVLLRWADSSVDMEALIREELR